MLNEKHIKEVMRLADEIADYAWKQGLSDGAYSQADHDRKSCDASRAALEANLRTIGDPENTFPLNPNGSSKWAHLQKHDGAEAIGVVFRTGSGSVGSLVDGRVVWADWLAHPISGEPESVNAELLDALKGMVDAHAIPSSYCKERSVYDQARAAIARAESAIESSHKHLEPWQPIETAPHDEVLLLACEFDGPGDWRIKCGYFNDDLGGWKVWGASWVPTRWAAIPAPPNLSDAARRDQTPAKVSPCAGHAVQQEAAESCAHRFVRDEEAPRHLCCQACGEVKNEADEAGGA